jgi:uncharacterized protein
MDKDAAKFKKEKLVHHLKELNSLLVAFSGGVDSTFLLAMAHEALGQNLLAVTADSVVHAVRETESACDFARKKGIRHILIQLDELSIPDFVSNTFERCYHCKRNLFKLLFETAGEKGINHVAHGANVDDLKDFRPGFRAAGEMGVMAPLVDVQLGKEEIRLLSKEMGLGTWDKPAMACLATRIPYGDSITEKKLNMVEEAETFLANNGFRQFRVRHHGSVARIEVEPSEIEKLTAPNLRQRLVDKFRQIGFLHVAFDLEGYVSGSMNRAIRDVRKEGPSQ